MVLVVEKVKSGSEHAARGQVHVSRLWGLEAINAHGHWVHKHEYNSNDRKE